MEILVLGDSLPFGRPNHGICRDLTWPYLLAKELNCGLQIRARGGATMIDTVTEANSLNGYWFEELNARKFDAVFVQAGIVDCCPRLLPRRIHSLISRVPGFGRLERSPYAYRLFGGPWVNEERFARSLEKLMKVLSAISRMSFFIEIAEPAHYLLENVGNFSASVVNYNDIIMRNSGVSNFVLWHAPDKNSHYLLPDGHHLSLSGHQAVARACFDKYQKIL